MQSVIPSLTVDGNCTVCAVKEVARESALADHRSRRTPDGRLHRDIRNIHEKGDATDERSGTTPGDLGFEVC